MALFTINEHSELKNLKGNLIPIKLLLDSHFFCATVIYRERVFHNELFC